MSWPLGVYRVLTSLAFAAGLPLLLLYRLGKGPFADRLGERLGFYPREIKSFIENLPERPIWFHAVSMGEVKLAVSLARLVREQLPRVPVLLSTTTPTGRALAERLLTDEIGLIYYPLDFYGAVKRSFAFLRPRLFVALETELWPNFLDRARKAGVPLFLVNGRISKRSLRRYLKIRGLFKPLLENFSQMVMIQENDAQAIISLGAPSEKVRVFGNMKFDGLPEKAQPEIEIRLRNQLQLRKGNPVWVAGSVRGGEEGFLLPAYERLKSRHTDLILILVPRHLENIPGLEETLKRLGLAYQLYSQVIQPRASRTADLILVDRMGVLFDLYCLATLVFCGGSLVPKGGQNILEAAAWGKPVLFGPFMDDFEDARRLLEGVGAGITVPDLDALILRIDFLLGHPEESARRGLAGQQALRSRQGVTQKVAEVIVNFVGKN
ncbi:MAG TPA: 3-deoxy-D-manno-octulosonic acid transferase [Thermodesulfobacteriota bacterium]|nr:3-deoxy-D-manno-octulosonic acid transferase [Thermodesulfobacteriota bacterium]